MEIEKKEIEAKLQKAEKTATQFMEQNEKKAKQIEDLKRNLEEQKKKLAERPVVE